MEKIHSVEDYISKHAQWHPHLQDLRELLLSTGMEEKIKWSLPVYCVNNKNVVGLAAFKDWFGLWFFQGATLTDEAKVLENAQAGKTKAMRHWKMYAHSDVQPERIMAYVLEAIYNQQTGNIIKPARRTTANLLLPEELKTAFQQNADLKMNFAALTPGRQREYAEYIGSAKKAATRERRLQKVIPLINDGKGLHDQYR